MTEIKTYAQPIDVATTFARDFADWVHGLPADQSKITVALSGGSTPKILFQHWAEKYSESIDWNRIHFFWGDERCVTPDDSDSNYGVAKELFLDKIRIDQANVHRVRGEDEPAVERARYESDIRQSVRIDAQNLPVFDLIILGMGDDGHTASIFPHQIEFLNSNRICEVATHPNSGQQRITLTGPVLNNASKVAFLITGANKAEVMSQVLNKTGNFESYPASHVDSNEVLFYLDQEAAKSISG